VLLKQQRSLLSIMSSSQLKKQIEDFPDGHSISYVSSKEWYIVGFSRAPDHTVMSPQSYKDLEKHVNEGFEQYAALVAREIRRAQK